MAADAQENPPEEVVGLLGIVEGSPEEAALNQRRDIFDSGYDQGWEAARTLQQEAAAGLIAQARLDGFKDGFATGFKEGFVVGSSDARPLSTIQG